MVDCIIVPFPKMNVHQITTCVANNVELICEYDQVSKTYLTKKILITEGALICWDIDKFINDSINSCKWQQRSF